LQLIIVVLVLIAALQAYCCIAAYCI